MTGDCYVEAVQKIVSAEELSEAQMATLAVQGIGCLNCATRVRNALLGLDGVVSANVDLERGLALVDYVPSKTNVGALVNAVSAAGNDGHHNYYAEILS